MKDLIKEYLSAKEAETEAKTRRVEAGLKLCSQLEYPEEGQKTHAVDGYKVTIKGTVNRRVDWDAFDYVAKHHPDKCAPFKIKKDLDVKGLHWTRDNEPDYYLALCDAISAAPGAPSIVIKESKGGK